MKRLRIILIALVLICSGATFPSAANHKASFINLVLKKGKATTAGVTEFLQATGHTVITVPVSTDGGYTWYSLTRIGFHFYISTVFTDGETIVGYEDEQVG